jgi:hypothetical protein
LLTTTTPPAEVKFLQLDAIPMELPTDCSIKNHHTADTKNNTKELLVTPMKTPLIRPATTKSLSTHHLLWSPGCTPHGLEVIQSFTNAEMKKQTMVLRVVHS